MEQQPFKRVGQENFITNPKMHQCWHEVDCKEGKDFRSYMIAGWMRVGLISCCSCDSGGSQISPGRDFLKIQPDTGTGSRSLHSDSAHRSGTASSRTRRCPSHSVRRRSRAGTCSDSRLPSPDREKQELTPCSQKFD